MNIIPSRIIILDIILPTRSYNVNRKFLVHKASSILEHALQSSSSKAFVIPRTLEEKDMYPSCASILGIRVSGVELLFILHWMTFFESNAGVTKGGMCSTIIDC